MKNVLLHYMNYFSGQNKTGSNCSQNYSRQFQFPGMAFLFFIMKLITFVSKNAESILYFVCFYIQASLSCMVPSRLRILRVSTFITPFSYYVYFHTYTPNSAWFFGII